MIEVKNLILGGGIAGLGVGVHCRKRDDEYLIIEKENFYGGLCASFHVGDFIFDYFIHLSFTMDEFVRRHFDKTPHYSHTPNPFNYYYGTWIKHPAMNNLYPLSQYEKDKILEGLANRDQYSDRWKENYEYWLRYQFGDYFAEHFPLVYTRKYWGDEAKNMETEWVGKRIYQPSIDEILQGMKTEDTPVTYYAKEMRYPITGGFGEYLKSFVNEDHIRMNERVVTIDVKNNIVITDKEEYRYEHLYSSIPLPELANIVINDKSEENRVFNESIKKLHWTSGYLISLGLSGVCSRKDLWDYIYDENIMVSRYYSPSLMSPNTAPSNCYSVQAEIYTKDGEGIKLAPSKLLEEIIDQMDDIGAIDKAKIVVKDVRFRKYCNVLFDHAVYKNREAALKYLKKKGINPIGRFGEWEYYWSDQSFMSGYKAAAEKI